jgi:hypothetical protein
MQLRDQGYRPSVAARRLIEEQALDEAEASRLVQFVYGTHEAVSAYEGDFPMGMLSALGIIAVGAACVAVPFVFDFDFTKSPIDLDLQNAFSYIGAGAGIMVAGAVRMLFVWINRGVPGAPQGPVY